PIGPAAFLTSPVATESAVVQRTLICPASGPRRVTDERAIVQLAAIGPAAEDRSRVPHHYAVRDRAVIGGFTPQPSAARFAICGGVVHHASGSVGQGETGKTGTVG